MKKEPILMPVLSDTMQTGRLTRWNKSVGDPVHKGDAIAEVETDKAILDVEAFADGYLAGPLAPLDEDIPVRQVIGYLVDTPATAQSADSAPQQEKPTTTPVVPETPDRSHPAASEAPSSQPVTVAPTTESATKTHIETSAGSLSSQVSAEASPKVANPHPAGVVGATPYARALAQDLDIDIRQVAPGPDGSIHASQVLAAALAPHHVDLRFSPPYEIHKASSMRAAVARNMVATLQTPTFRTSGRFDLSPLHQQSKNQGVSLTLALARACALTVAEDPWFNHCWTPQGLAIRKRVDVGIAVDIDGGLVTPVLRDMATRPLPELAEDWRILLSKTKSGRLVPEDYQGASFYLSNLGIFPEITQFDAIVPVGASAILAVSAPGTDGCTDLTISCDHRVIFGADAARFLQRLAQRLRNLAWLQ
ncbi:MAG: 2-oxo acid dehydrogenase subunit E2 [Acidithiobacillus sp.]|nr:2-oxo acid dehydrogenase subunit E2 [Acidithiobacillus sp.]